MYSWNYFCVFGLVVVMFLIEVVFIVDSVYGMLSCCVILIIVFLFLWFIIWVNLVGANVNGSFERLFRIIVFRLMFVTLCRIDGCSFILVNSRWVCARLIFDLAVLLV